MSYYLFFNDIIVFSVIVFPICQIYGSYLDVYLSDSMQLSTHTIQNIIFFENAGISSNFTEIINKPKLITKRASHLYCLLNKHHYRHK